MINPQLYDRCLHPFLPGRTHAQPSVALSNIACSIEPPVKVNCGDYNTSCNEEEVFMPVVQITIYMYSCKYKASVATLISVSPPNRLSWSSKMLMFEVKNQPKLNDISIAMKLSDTGEPKILFLDFYQAKIQLSDL